MQGFHFLLINQDGPVAYGIITQQITPEKYLCTFLQIPQVSRVVDITEIQEWNLFPNSEALQAFLTNLRKQKQPTPPVKEKSPTPKKRKSS
jgi:hypothetical protein